MPLCVFAVADAVVTTTRPPGSSVDHCHPDTMWTCRDGTCIGVSLVCNGEADCMDGSDEGPGCHLLTPQTGTAAAAAANDHVDDDAVVAVVN